VENLTYDCLLNLLSSVLEELTMPNGIEAPGLKWSFDSPSYQISDNIPYITKIVWEGFQIKAGVASYYIPVPIKGLTNSV